MFCYVTHSNQTVSATVIIIFFHTMPLASTDVTETEIVANFGFLSFFFYCGAFI
jgi:hypothetical protein